MKNRKEKWNNDVLIKKIQRNHKWCFNKKNTKKSQIYWNKLGKKFYILINYEIK
jgi:hypothetical protein